MKTFAEAQAAKLATFTEAERAEYDVAYEEAGVGIDLAQMFYDVRTGEGLTQTQLAKRMHTTQPAIARIENGAQTPSVPMMSRLAAATGKTLRVQIA